MTKSTKSVPKNSLSLVDKSTHRPFVVPEPNYCLRHLLDDGYLSPYHGVIQNRRNKLQETVRRLTRDSFPLEDFASAHEHFGLHFEKGKWIFREWAPNANKIVMVGDFSGWKALPEFTLQPTQHGNWELKLPADAIKHGDLYKLHVHWNGGWGERIPAYVRRVVQDEKTKIFCAQVWNPPKAYQWKNKDFRRPANTAPIIYEAHVGMAQEKEGVGTYAEFRQNVLPRVVDAGYNTLQLMAIMEHPYYGSFGYHVSSFFAASSRFGTPEDLKELIDAAHSAGLAVIMDLVHSHAVMNEVEGLSKFDGTLYQYFHDMPRGHHVAWDSRCFDYGKTEVLHFLLSNCRFWLDEYKIDGYRFDGVTSMLYLHHGLGPAFDHYDRYFDSSVDEDAWTYLSLANRIIHKVRPDAMTIAEDVSGMPGLAATAEDGGAGFDFRLAMGVPDMWFKLINDTADESWNMQWMWWDLTNRRGDERVIGYAESHDQAIVGGKSIIFEMIDKEMYWDMHVNSQNLLVDRGIALHKMIRLITLAGSDSGYLNFIGNEFGHPEWVDFPRAGNNWSYKYARRLWSLRDNPDLKYHFLADFDKAMVNLMKERSAIGNYHPRTLLINDGDKVIAFERGGLFFFFNFHPSKSYTDYAIETLPGEYVLLMDTDEARFGGHKRLEAGQRYKSEGVNKGGAMVSCIKLYLPCRCGLVLGYLGTGK